MAPSRPSTSQAPFCILNGHSIHAEAAKTQLGRIAPEYGIQAEVVVTKPGDDISVIAAHALNACRHPIVAGGGDGTVNAVAGKLAGTDTALGVLPMGTLNHFAKDTGIPLDLEAAVRNLFTGKITRVDVGEVNGRVFVNNSGIGFYPHFVRQREAQQHRGYPKPLAFVRALRSVIRRYLRLRMRVRLDEVEALERVTPFLFVGNNPYETSGPAIATRPTLQSGRLWVCTARSGRRNIVRLALGALTGRDTEELTAFETQEIWVDPGTALVNVSLDGEVKVMDPPLHYRIRPASLAVIVSEH